MNPLRVSAPLRLVLMASPVQFNLPATIKACEIKKMNISDLITRVNAAPPIDPDNNPPDVTSAAVHEFLLGQTSSFRHLCRSHSKNTIERQPMFFGESNNTWLRPTFGLRRTFSPFMVKHRNAP
ncbi:small capsid protein [Macropodid alphaherpesvirus 4]|uniref:Small capsomere-interacting protein n=1 Tax=Macropodid alphaherpesvirus 4 TaxID=2762721 RepID=A0A7L7YSF6_9ALPH|nr:small capsid protein [Macropodid alphaherpesvirus 4]QOD40182.1 small capsid protein [Macropodid alphaherpesvirus 4]